MNLFMAGNRGKWGPQLVRPIARSIGSDLYCAILSRRRFAKHRTAPHSTMAPSVILFIYEGFILTVYHRSTRKAKSSMLIHRRGRFSRGAACEMSH